MAILMGAVVALQSKSESSRVRPEAKKFTPNSVMALVFVVLSGWAIYESCGIEAMRSAQREIKLFNNSAGNGTRELRRGPLEKSEWLLTLAKWIRPDDAQARYIMGDVHIARFRQLQTNDMLDQIQEEKELIQQAEEGSQAEKDAAIDALDRVDSKMIWDSSAVALLHQRLRFAEKNQPERVSEVLSSPGVETYLRKAYQEFVSAEEACPRMAGTQVRLAQLCGLAAPKPADESILEESEHVQRALDRSVAKTQLMFSCGLLALNSRNQDVAVRLWRKCLELPHKIQHERAIVALSLNSLPMKRFYEEVLPPKPHYLLKIVKRYFKSPALSLPKRFLAVHINRTINEQHDLGEMERMLLLAETATLAEDYPEVVKQYGFAIELADGDAPWRYDYAFALFQTKQFDESVRQLKMCELDQRIPKNRVKQLLAKIRRSRTLP